jgi:hypothetical protein
VIEKSLSFQRLAKASRRNLFAGPTRATGVILAFVHHMRTRIWLTIIAVMVLAVVPAASAFPVALAIVPIALIEPGSLLLLGISLLTLAGVVQRAFFS